MMRQRLDQSFAIKFGEQTECIYGTTSRTGAPGRRISIHNVFMKANDWHLFFLKMHRQNSRVSYASVENF